MTTTTVTNQAAAAEHTRATTSRRRLSERIGRSVVAKALSRMKEGCLEVRDADAVMRSGSGTPEAIITVVDPAFYARIAFGGDVGAGEAWMDGLWTCDNLPRAIELLTRNREAMHGMSGPAARATKQLTRAGAFLKRNTRAGSKRNIHAHYDLSNALFALFLDPTMTYSSGIYTHPETTLAEAQYEKLDRVCRKLELDSQHHLLEIGTGWGSMAMHAARTRGCRVTTTTISREQHDLASERIAQAGLSDLIDVQMTDYRDLTGAYDAVVSIEMIEAVGAEFLDGYFQTLDRVLKPGGRALIQAITICDRAWRDASRRIDFLKKYIFPGSCLLSVNAMSNSVARTDGLRVLHMDDFGVDYARTLADWRANFHANSDAVRQLGFDERFMRMWDYYLAYCEGVFASRYTSDVQLLLGKGDAVCPSMKSMAHP